MIEIGSFNTIGPSSLAATMDGKSSSAALSIKAIQDAVALIAAIAGIIYAAGYVIVTSKLLQWGIAEFDLVKSRYISVGCLFFINLGLVLVIPWFLMSRGMNRLGTAKEHFLRILRMRRKKAFDSGGTSDEPIEKIAQLAEKLGIDSTPVTNSFAIWLKRIFKITLAVLGCFVLTVAISIGFILLISTPTWAGAQGSTVAQQLFANKWQLIGFWFLPLFLAGLSIPLLPGTRPSAASLFKIPDWRLVAAGILLCVLAATRIYANYIFTHISPAVGGGDFYRVKVIVKAPEKDSPDLLSKLLPLEADRRSGCIWLYDESNDYYFFLFAQNPSDEDCFNIPSPAAVAKVEKKMIAAVIYD